MKSRFSKSSKRLRRRRRDFYSCDILLTRLVRLVLCSTSVPLGQLWSFNLSRGFQQLLKGFKSSSRLFSSLKNLWFYAVRYATDSCMNTKFSCEYHFLCFSNILTNRNTQWMFYYLKNVVFIACFFRTSSDKRRLIKICTDDLSENMPIINIYTMWRCFQILCTMFNIKIY